MGIESREEESGLSTPLGLLGSEGLLRTGMTRDENIATSAVNRRSYRGGYVEPSVLAEISGFLARGHEESN
jgi:hypothetical protein